VYHENPSVLAEESASISASPKLPEPVGGAVQRRLLPAAVHSLCQLHAATRRRSLRSRIQRNCTSEQTARKFIGLDGEVGDYAIPTNRKKPNKTRHVRDSSSRRNLSQAHTPAG